MSFKKESVFPGICLLIYLVEFVIFAIHPSKMSIWITENLIASVTVLILFILYRKGIRFSNISYTLMLIALTCQTIGGHYTFGAVPFDFITELFDFQRNHFDRVGHFMVGFFAYPVMEYYEQKALIKGRLLTSFLVVMGIFGIAGLFEVAEWLYVEIAAKDVGIAFLGTQDDIWDAQKDILCDGLGAIFTVILYVILNRRKAERSEE